MVRWSAKIGLGALVVPTVLAYGCASERDPISREQPNRMDKTFFVGQSISDPSDDPEFRHRSYVVDASASQSLVGIGEWGHIDRIRWEITENMLLARKAYQIAEGQDNKGIPQWQLQNDPNVKADKYFTKTPNGTIVAAYRILSHFDVRRDYNPQTGEELNVVGENTTDRPWQQRQYMRVDWSQNLVDNPMSSLFLGRLFGDITVTPVSFYVDNPEHVDAPHFETNDGYFDITNKFTVAPAGTYTGWPGLPFLPTCVLMGIYTGSGTYECDAQEAVVRNSYWKIDQEADQDFERLENTKAAEDIVGNPGGGGSGFIASVITPPRQKYDPQYGYTDQGLAKFANIHNLWKKSHAAKSCDASFDEDKDGTDDQCVGASNVGGSRCDVWVKKCTIPYREREVKPIAYWINREAPDELQDPVDSKGNPTKGKFVGTLEDLAVSWNQLLRVAVGTAREVECRRTGSGSREDCHAQFFDSTRDDPSTMQMVSYGGWLVEKTKDTKDALVYCHNPVREYDNHEACGPTGTTARVGDIRRNFIYYWPYESRAPWGGIADWNGDPLTGQMFGAAAQVMGRSATFAAAQQRDVIQLALGDLVMDNIIKGVPAERYAKQLKEGRAPESYTPEQIRKITESVDVNHMKSKLGLRPLDVRGLAQMKSRAVFDPTMRDTAMLEYEALAKKLRGTIFEAQIVDNNWMTSALGAPPNAKLDDAVMDTVSPLRGMDPGRLGMFRDSVTEALRAKGVCFLENEAPANGSIYYGALAGYFKDKYGDLDPTERGKRIYDDLWHENVKGIALHEVGHSLGMYHNFASSWDAPNYNPQYWQLRTNEGRGAEPCIADANGNMPAPDTCMGPRYVDPETLDEQGLAGEHRPGIEYFANTSTMEYQIERAGESAGLGTYDLHTMKTLYGRVLETHDTKVVSPREQQAFKFKTWTQLIERDLIVDRQLGWKHYTSAARLMKVFDAARDCRDATDEEKVKAAWRIVHGKICAPTPKDHWAWRDFQYDSLDPVSWKEAAPYWHVVDNEGVERVRWHYRFGQTSNAYFHTNPTDAGADAYEAVLNTERRFDLTYPWSYFRRQRREYGHWTLPWSTSAQYFERLRSYHWQIANDLARISSAAQATSPDDLEPYIMAQDRMFRMLTRAVLMPQPGTYGQPEELGRRQPPDVKKSIFDTPDSIGEEPQQPAFVIGIGDGRYIGDDFDNYMGGSWDYQSFINHVGFSIEKILALGALVDGRPTLFTVSRENELDGRNVKINFRIDLPDAVDRLFGGILAEDWESVGLHVEGSRDVKEMPPQMLNIAQKGSTRPAGSRILFPNVGYKQQLGAVIFANLFARANTDMTLVNKMRIWIDGQDGSITLPPSQQVRFTDPNSGYTYIARKYGNEEIDGKQVDKGIASRMVQHANALLIGSFEVERDTVTGNPILDQFGQPTLKLGADGQPKPSNLNGTFGPEYQKYVGVLDAVKQIGMIFGYGPLGGADD